MAIKVDDLVVELTLEDGKYIARMKGAGAAALAFQSQIKSINGSVTATERRVRGFTSSLRDWTLVVGQMRNAITQVHFLTTGWMTSIIKANAEVERMTFLMKGFSKAAGEAGKLKEATKTVNDLFEMAKRTPFQVNALSDSFVKMKSVGIDPMKGSLKSLTDAVAAFGGSSDVLKRASIAVQQMAGKGVISMEELRQQMGEAVPRSIELMARSMGVSYGELVKEISKGNVEARSALNAMFGEFERVFGDRGLALMESFNGQWSKMITNLTLLETQSAGMKAFFAEITSGLKDLNFYLESPAGKQFADDLGRGLASLASGMKTVIQTFYEWRGAIVTAGKAFLVVFAARGMSALLSTLAVRTKSITTAYAAMTIQLNNAKLAQAGNYATATQLAGVYGRMGPIARTAAAGIGLIGVSLVSMLGPLTIAVMGIMELINILDVFGSKHRKILGQIADGELITQSGDIQKRREAVQALAKDNEELFRTEAALTDKIARFAKGGADERGPLKQMRADLAEIKPKAEAAREAIYGLGKAVEDQTAVFLDFKASGIAESMIDPIRAGVTTLRDTYDTAMKGITDSTKSGSKERVDAAIAAQGTLYEGSISLYQNFIDEQSATLKSGLDVDVVAVKKSIAEASRQINDLRQSQESGANSLRLGIVSAGAGSDKGDKTGNTVLSAILSAHKAFAKTAFDLKTESEQALQRISDPFAFEMPEAVDNLRTRLFGVLQPLEQLKEKSPQAAAALALLRGEMEGLVRASAGVEANKIMASMNDRTRAIKTSLLDERSARNQAFREELTRLDRMKTEMVSWGVWTEEHERIRIENIAAMRQRLNADNHKALTDYANEWKSTSEKMEGLLVDTFHGISDALADAVTTGKLDLEDFSKSILQTFLRIQTNSAFSAIFDLINGEGGESGGGIFGKIASGLGSLIGSAFGGSSTPAIGSGGSVPTNHTGGIAGREASFFKSVSPGAFVGAPRYHNGGIAGDEVPSILRRGEGVFTEGQMKALGSAGKANVTVNVINNTDREVNAEQGQPRFDGEQMILDVVLSHASKSGGFRDNLKGALA